MKESQILNMVTLPALDVKFWAVTNFETRVETVMSVPLTDFMAVCNDLKNVKSLTRDWMKPFEKGGFKVSEEYDTEDGPFTCQIEFGGKAVKPAEDIWMQALERLYSDAFDYRNVYKFSDGSNSLSFGLCRTVNTGFCFGLSCCFPLTVDAYECLIEDLKLLIVTDQYTAMNIGVILQQAYNQEGLLFSLKDEEIFLSEKFKEVLTSGKLNINALIKEYLARNGY